MAVVTRLAVGMMAVLALPVWAVTEPAFYIGGGASVVYRANNGNSQNDSFSETHVTPNLQIGVMRPINERWSLGTGLELTPRDMFSWGDSKNLLTWRIGELGYQISEQWGFSFYGGASRFYRNNPGWGYGFGSGLYYQLSPKMVLGAEINYVLTRTSYPQDVPYEKEHFGWGSMVVKYRF
ncbi:outer membrane beta-barrel protein [Ferrimonas balearica]|uniref:outer membrane beta-barrel protein n=1 Tax=Ferrimonas balearica TaxID=44012 RepID=UPI001C98F2C6|nr:outer membrane beta-barrel protein [Ferrimonas balearica]MBY5994080.1 porin family protein [Ferrimonas balearica]